MEKNLAILKDYFADCTERIMNTDFRRWRHKTAKNVNNDSQNLTKDNKKDEKTK